MTADISRTGFVRTYRQNATQLDTLILATDWYHLAVQLAADGITLTADEAAAWASRGYHPGEAEHSIRAGITAATDAELEDHAEQQAGGADNLAAQRIADMLNSGQLVREDQVARIPDPTDPEQEIIVLRDGEQ